MLAGVQDDQLPLRQGRLNLYVTPASAQVFVDGFYAGTVADFQDRGLWLESGPHRIELRADGYQTAKRLTCASTRTDLSSIRRDLATVDGSRRCAASGRDAQDLLRDSRDATPVIRRRRRTVCQKAARPATSEPSRLFCSPPHTSIRHRRIGDRAQLPSRSRDTASRLHRGRDASLDA